MFIIFLHTYTDIIKLGFDKHRLLSSEVVNVFKFGLKYLVQ